VGEGASVSTLQVACDASRIGTGFTYLASVTNGFLTIGGNIDSPFGITTDQDDFRLEIRQWFERPLGLTLAKTPAARLNYPAFLCREDRPKRATVSGTFQYQAGHGLLHTNSDAASYGVTCFPVSGPIFAGKFQFSGHVRFGPLDEEGP